jgi:PAS domain-containing protein
MGPPLPATEVRGLGLIGAQASNPPRPIAVVSLQAPRVGEVRVRTVDGTQKPLELILARNLLSSLSTAAFLVDDGGMIAFYNEAAGELLGRRFEEAGPMTADEWGRAHGPFGPDGDPIPFSELELTKGLLRGRAGHASFCIHSWEGKRCPIEASALPIVAGGGQRGAMVFFWKAPE